MTKENRLIHADWPAPSHVHAITTTRVGGASRGAYQGFNLADHVGDDPVVVANNRFELERLAHLPSQPVWLNQTHSTDVIVADANVQECARQPFGRPTKQPVEQPKAVNNGLDKSRSADASTASSPNVVCSVLTADCLPILLSNQKGDWVAAIHAGWRGLLNGIIENTLSLYRSNTSDLLAWLGPAISQAKFEVGEDVRQLFLTKNANDDIFFKAYGKKYLADLYGIARNKLTQQGVAVYGGHFCTHQQPELFFSYRRDGETGRMASLIWFETLS